MDSNDKAALARVEQQVIGIKDSFDKHEEQDEDRFEATEKHSNERFERTFNFVKGSFDKIDGRFDKMEEKLGTLWDTKNKQEGAFGLSKILAGSVGGFLVLIADFIIGGGHIK